MSAAPELGNRKYWAKPSSMPRSICPAMGISRRDPIYRKFSNSMRSLAEQFLDTSRNLDSQDPERWQKFFRKVVQSHPFVTKFQDSWPVEAYVRRHLSRTKWLHTRKATSTNSVRSNRAVAGVGGDGNANDAPRRLRDTSTQSQVTISSSASATSTAPSASIALSQSRPRARVGPAPSASPAAVPAPSGVQVNAPPPPPKTSPFKLREETVRQFLRSLNPTLEDLTQRFISAGLVNKKCLVALAGMPDWEKDKLLRDDMCLTPFQSRVVRVGLGELE
ncbi:uncharacterized protein B0H18DRAFT_647088 [Fomitopsis serialis]|uniref:uncharacterized protein n=1 Tax=Fomitopsis serialis TaxID=139415 RepID=UPI00200764AF|nr:uncharacterized protein B0H18DRAFT_647088 [Neoantrodia serialis]KAH9933489.1 hypothetical protein B0H18DRAFT_647088 [Neoantrodia serialis]